MGRRCGLVITALPSVQKSLDLQMLMCRQRACHVNRTLASSSQPITIPTEGTVEYNLHAYKSCFLLIASHSHSTCSYPYWDSNCKEVQMVREVVSQGESTSSIPVKMHLLEEHTVPWAKRTYIYSGFGGGGSKEQSPSMRSLTPYND